MNQTPARSPFVWRACPACIALLPILLFSSCASLPELPWAPVTRDVSAGFYNEAKLEYRLDAGKLGQPLEVLSVDGRQVKYEPIASSPVAGRSLGKLTIEKPHPAGREGYARVTFAIDSDESAAEARSGWDLLNVREKPPQIGHHEEVHEVWALDVPAAEADHYFQLLTSLNFYNATPPDNAAAYITVTLDGRKVDKAWNSQPELNALAQQVRSQGRLVAYLRPSAMGGEPSQAIASVRTYRDLVAKTSGDATAKVTEKPMPYAIR
jgi:hypothetical protein